MNTNRSKQKHTNNPNKDEENRQQKMIGFACSAYF